MENETVRKRISQSSALRQKRKALELEPVHKPQGPETVLMENMNGDDLLSPLTEVGLIQASGSNGFANSGDHTTENSLRSDEEEIYSPASPLEYSKFESKHSRSSSGVDVVAEGIVLGFKFKKMPKTVQAHFFFDFPSNIALTLLSKIGQRKVLVFSLVDHHFGLLVGELY